MKTLILGIFCLSGISLTYGEQLNNETVETTLLNGK